MKARLNRNLLEQTRFDSGMPGGLGMIVHRFETPGEYEIALVRDERVVERVTLIVAQERSEEEAGRKMPPSAREAELPSQVNIELGQARRAVLMQSPSELEEHYAVRAGGYTSFTATRREDASAVVVRRRGEEGEEELFDSRRLEEGDIFALTMVRPGAYALNNAETGATGEIRVAYPTVGKEPYRPPDPISVECTDQGFSPADIDLMPAQGIIFHVRTPTRIQIDLVEPDDGPEGAREPKVAGWRKPLQQQTGPETDDKTSQSAY